MEQKENGIVASIFSGNKIMVWKGKLRIALQLTSIFKVLS